MKPYLVDVPVLLFVFVRPSTLKLVFDVIRKARPSVLFLMSDGPRESVPSDKERIAESRSIVENIDWECDVHRYYSVINKGMYKTLYDSLGQVFNIVDRLIILEDDVLPNQSFFPFCAETLEKYKNDERIQMVCGMNHLGVYEAPEADYFFSKAGSIWGFALWKRTYDSFEYKMKYAKDNYILDMLKKNTPSFQKSYIPNAQNYMAGSFSDDKRVAFEFQCGVSMYLQNRLLLVPKKNMICYLGATEGSTHAPNNIKLLPKVIRKIFNMQTYEYEFPLKHPAYVIEDKNYEKKVNRIMGWGHPIIQFYIRTKFIIRQLIYGDRKEYAKKILKKIFERN